MFNTKIIPNTCLSPDFSLVIKRFDYKNHSYEMVAREKHICIDPSNIHFNQIHSEITFGLIVKYPEYKFQDVFYDQTKLNVPYCVMSGFLSCLKEYIHEKQPTSLLFTFLETDRKLFDLIKTIPKTKYSQLIPQYEWIITDNFNATKIIFQKKG